MMGGMKEYRGSWAIFLHPTRIRGQMKRGQMKKGQMKWGLGGLVEVHREWTAGALGQQVHRVADPTDEVTGFK